MLRSSGSGSWADHAGSTPGAAEMGPGRLYRGTQFLRHVDYVLRGEGGTYTPAEPDDAGASFQLERMDGGRVLIQVGRGEPGQFVVSRWLSGRGPLRTAARPAPRRAVAADRRATSRAAAERATPAREKPIEPEPEGQGPEPVMACRYRFERAVCDLAIFLRGTTALEFVAVANQSAEDGSTSTHVTDDRGERLAVCADTVDGAVAGMVAALEARYGAMSGGPESVPDSLRRCGLGYRAPSR